MKIVEEKYYSFTEWGYYREDGIFIVHREDGPARIMKNGNMYWIYHDRYHREDGPACEFNNGDKSWYYHDVEAKDEEEFYSKEFRDKALLSLVK